MPEIIKIRVGGLPISLETCQSAAQNLLDHAMKARQTGELPIYSTSANGQVLSHCALDSNVRELFLKADIINADGESIVKASKLFCSHPLPERVATTDLFHDVAKQALDREASFYFLGSSDDEIKRAVEKVHSMYPALNIIGYRNGYFTEAEEEGIISEINRLKPDVLWIGMGIPREQSFVVRNLENLNVGAIKTCGGLFNFLSGKNKRAPQWMQDAGFEWLYRAFLEPRRLAWRYLTTNPHAMWLLLTKSR